MESAETIEEQTVLRMESAETIEEQTVLRMESAETIEEQTVLRMESAETIEEQTVLRMESAETIEDQTVLRKESAKTIEDQTVLRMEEEANVSQSPSPQAETLTSQSTGTRSAGTAEDLSAQTEASAFVSASVPQSVCGRGIDLTTQDLFIPELEMNRLLYEKDMRIHFLVQENYDLVRRAQNVKREITHICPIKMNIGMRLSAQRMLESNAYQKLRDLERAVHTEREKAMEAETCLDREIEETSKIKTSLVQAQDQLEKSRCLWEQEKSQILAKHSQETHRLEAALLQVQEGGKKERFQWQLKMSTLEESLNTINQALEGMKEDNVEYVEEMRILEEMIQVVESKEAIFAETIPPVLQ